MLAFLFHVLLPWMFNSFLIYNHFTWYSFQTVWPCYILSFFYHLLCHSKNFILLLRIIRSRAHFLCFFFFAEEITLFALCLHFLYSIHASFEFSPFHFLYVIFFSLTASATSSFHHHVSYVCKGVLTFHICAVLFPSLSFSSCANVHLHPGVSTVLALPCL